MATVLPSRPSYCPALLAIFLLPELDRSLTVPIKNSNSFLGLLAGLILLTTGCGGPGHNRTEVTGVLTLDGEPLPAGMHIVFTPADSETPIAFADAGAEGRFQVYGEPGKIGMYPGEFTVSVEVPYADEPGPYSGPPELADIKIPPAYQTGKSKVTFTVPDDGTTFDIAMTSK